MYIVYFPDILTALQYANNILYLVKLISVHVSYVTRV